MPRGNFLPIHPKAHVARTKRRKAIGAKMGRMKKTEREALIEVAARAPESVDIKRMSEMMHRSPEAIKEMILAARRKLQENSEKYVDIHLQAAEAALAGGDFDTARKAAETIFKTVGEGDVRLTDGERQELKASGPQILIGVSVGAAKALPEATTIDVKPVDVE